MSVRPKQQGFVILYAVIVTTVVVVIGVTLMNIVTKQIILSAISRNAKIAYYAALSGKDCAEFWKNVQGKVDLERIYFGGDLIDVDGNITPTNPTESSLVCNGQQIEFGRNEPTVTLFDLALENDGLPACAKVTVSYYPDIVDPACADQKLFIQSEGYNDSCTNVNTSVFNPRRVKSVYSDRYRPECHGQ